MVWFFISISWIINGSYLICNLEIILWMLSVIFNLFSSDNCLVGFLSHSLPNFSCLYKVPPFSFIGLILFSSLVILSSCFICLTIYNGLGIVQKNGSIQNQITNILQDSLLLCNFLGISNWTLSIIYTLFSFNFPCLREISYQLILSISLYVACLFLS